MIIKHVDLKNIGKFINIILSGKINNKYDAEKEYIKKLRKMKIIWKMLNQQDMIF